MSLLRRVLVGEPLPTARAAVEKLPKYLALPIFASDALSSTAYGPEEVLLALAAGGALALRYSVPVVVAIVTLVLIVTASYRQIVYAYPSGGGSYVVAKENLGIIPGLLAAAALLIDYTLTVAVSIAAGVAALASAYPLLNLGFAGISLRVLLALFFVLVLVLGNLRGVRESGFLFALPTYLFLASFGLMLLMGAIRAFQGLPAIATPPPLPVAGVEAIGIFLILRAFASGCSALTGLEAVSNGVQVFRRPESRNAAITMVWIGSLLVILVMGLTLLARHFGIPPDLSQQQTLASRVAAAVVGKTWLYYAVQWTTTGVLVIAANSAFAGFPRLAAILGQDSFAPRQLRNLGDRLVYANGIILLGAMAAALIVIFGGSTNRLIPLYAVGVFLSFTLAQLGMVRRWARERRRGWRLSAAMNLIGGVATGLVLVIIAAEKFTRGAFAVVILIPVLVWAFLKVQQHYRRLAGQLTLEGFVPKVRLRHQVIVLVDQLHRGVMPALLYARKIDDAPEAVHMALDPEQSPTLRARWQEYVPGMPLIILPAPGWSMRPLLDYIDTIRRERHLDLVTVVVPEFATTRWWHRLLHRQSGFFLKLLLLARADVVVTNVRYWVEADPAPPPGAAPSHPS